MTDRLFILALFASILRVSVQSHCDKRSMNVGTVLFAESDLLKDCWSGERITLLTYRMVLEDVLPSPGVLKAKGEEFVSEIVDYFKLVLEVVRRVADVNNKHLMLLALTDLLGGYMNHVVLPVAKYAYYSGTLNYENTQKLYQLFDELKCFLRTNGEGWEKPMKITADKLDIQALPAESHGGVNPCKGLILYEHPPIDSKAEKENTGKCTFEIPMPFLDSRARPSAIAVPFKTFSLRNLESKASAYVLVKFYIASHKCLAYKKAKAEDVSTYDNKFFTWINRFVVPHLVDEKFYAAFGGALRVYETLKESGIGHGGSKEIGNYNVMPEVEEKEPINDLESGEVENRQESDISRMIIYIVLAVIFVWFLVGLLFICYKIRANRSKQKEDTHGPRKRPPSPESKQSRSWPQMTPHSPSTKSVKSEKKTQSAVYSTPKGSSSTQKSFSQTDRSKSCEVCVASETVSAMSHVETAIDQAAEADFPDEGEDEDEETTLPVPSKQVFYPPSCACHTSIAGRMKIASSSEEGSSRSGEKKTPYVFGYEFQTSSSENTPRGGQSDAEDMKGNMSR